jgi:hypothetical protein
MEASLNLPTSYGSYIGLSLKEPINTSGTELYGFEFNTQTPVLYKSKDRLEGIRSSCKYQNYSWILHSIYLMIRILLLSAIHRFESLVQIGDDIINMFDAN